MTDATYALARSAHTVAAMVAGGFALMVTAALVLAIAAVAAWHALPDADDRRLADTGNVYVWVTA